MTDPLPFFWVVFGLDIENFVKLPEILFIQFGSEGVLKKKVNHLLNELQWGL